MPGTEVMAAPTAGEPVERRSDGLSVRLILGAYVLLVGFLLAMVGISAVAQVPLDAITQDAASHLAFPIYIGLLSQVGLVLWSVVIGVLLVTYLAVHRRASAGVRGVLREAGLLSTLLLVDDGFLVHERIAPRLLGLSETVLPMVYGAIIVAFLVRHRRSLRTTRVAPLLLALLFGGLSLLFDLISDTAGPLAATILLEDGAKFLALGSWLLYFTSYCLMQLRLLSSPPPLSATNSVG